MVIQDRLKVDKPNVDFGIVCALFIVDRGFADFSSRFTIQGRFEADGPNVDFTCFVEMGVALANLATAVPTSVKILNSEEVCNGFADFISDAGEQ